MPTRNRGPQPQDAELFSDRYLPALRAATDDLCWLLDRGYGSDSALHLVGNRYRLNKRQRQAVGRCAAAATDVEQRQSKRVELADLAGKPVAIDGFNLLILLETAAGGGVVLGARDGALRDLASVHGTYKHVRQTVPALLRVGEALRQCSAVTWYFDAPVSNSGRLKTMLRELAEANDFGWATELVVNPDRTLIDLPHNIIRISSDRWILDEVAVWCNLGSELVPAERVVWL